MTPAAALALRRRAPAPNPGTLALALTRGRATARGCRALALAAAAAALAAAATTLAAAAPFLAAAAVVLAAAALGDIVEPDGQRLHRLRGVAPQAGGGRARHAREERREEARRGGGAAAAKAQRADGELAWWRWEIAADCVVAGGSAEGSGGCSEIAGPSWTRSLEIAPSAPCAACWASKCAAASSDLPPACGPLSSSGRGARRAIQ